jgi:signal transduction histidine kinase
LQGIGRDITERKQVEEDLLQSRRAALNMMTDAVEARDRAEQISKALKSSEVFNQALIANSPIGISVRSRTGDLLSSNTAWRNIWALSEEEYQGMLKEKSDELRFDERDVILLPYQEQVRQVYEQGGFLSLSDLKTLYFRPGNAEWVSQYYYGIMDDQGQVDRVVTLTEDITARKWAEGEIRTLNTELEQRVIQRTAQLEAANKELEAFSYSVSHDLRAPLRGIDGWSLALLEDHGSQLDEQAKTYLQRVRSETQRMGQLIDDLLQLSRLTSTEMNPRKVNLSALAGTIAARLQKAQPERQVKFVIQPRLNANGDARLLEIALTNLLGNAFKFTGKTPQARIEFGQTEVEGRRAFFVGDNGAGFDMALAKKLFGAFQRMHKASDFPGTGVGLTTVQRIVHRHGGRIWAEATVDQGATFFFTIEESL